MTMTMTTTLSLLSTTSDPNNHGVALVVMALTLKCLANPGVKFSLIPIVGSCRWSSEDPILMGIVYLQALIHQTLGIPHKKKPCWSDSRCLVDSQGLLSIPMLPSLAPLLLLALFGSCCLPFALFACLLPCLLACSLLAK